jgi:glycosyltransferase involved in cell wall biosynthesis
VAPERIVVASGGLDRLQIADCRLQIGGVADPRTVLCVAQWIARKGLLELARAWAQAARPGWRLELVGETGADPAYAVQVRAALAQAPAGSVLVRGALDDAALAQAYASAAIFAMPSHYEGYGIAFAEALAHGLPVVGCAVGPVPALVGPEAGLLVPPGDVAALAAALGALMDDAGLRASMGAAAHARAASLPTWDSCAARVLAALRAAIRARRG